MIVRADEAQSQPWKNGGGSTRELLAGPAGADWRWRISLADIAADGPFSAFPGVRRWFAVIEGDGVTLDLAAGSHRLHPGDEALAFDGAEAPMCRLIGAPTRDLNLMLRGVRGVMRRAVPGRPWDEAWALRGRFDIAARTLEWGLPPGPLSTEVPALWIGIDT